MVCNFEWAWSGVGEGMDSGALSCFLLRFCDGLTDVYVGRMREGSGETIDGWVLGHCNVDGVGWPVSSCPFLLHERGLYTHFRE